MFINRGKIEKKQSESKTGTEKFDEEKSWDFLRNIAEKVTNFPEDIQERIEEIGVKLCGSMSYNHDINLERQNYLSKEIELRKNKITQEKSRS